jgi:hypothetical protein
MAMTLHVRQELYLKIGVAFSWLMTKAYLDVSKEKFKSVAEHRNILGNERGQLTWMLDRSWTSRLAWPSAVS